MRGAGGIETGTAGSWRCAASPGSISTAGWSGKAGPSPTGVTRMRTLPRSRGHGRQGAGCGVGRSYRRGIGAGASVLVVPSRRVSKSPGGARSRATSARTARASTTFRAGGTTSRPESIPRRGNGGSAPRAKHGRKDGGAQGSNSRDRGAAPPSVTSSAGRDGRGSKKARPSVGTRQFPGRGSNLTRDGRYRQSTWGTSCVGDVAERCRR